MVPSQSIPCIKTDWYDSFACIGGECPYTCCGGYWNITVDEETDRKYQALEGEFAAKLNDWIDRSQKPARMQLNVLGCCGMLTDDGWCAVQRTLGEEYLCKTCREYPRTRYQRDGILIVTLPASCPVVARRELGDTTPLRLVEGTAAHNTGEAPETDETAYAALLTGIRLLQDRDCSVAQRQKLFLMLNQALRDAAGDEKATAELLRFFKSPVNYRALAAEPDRGCDLVGKLRLLSRLCQPLLRDISHPQTRAVFEEILDDIVSDADAMTRAGAYLAQWNEGELACALENILVDGCLYHYLDTRCGDCFEQAGYVVVMSQLLRIFCAVGSQKQGKPLPLDEQVRYWTFLSRGFEHSGKLKEEVSKLLRNEGMMELPFLFRLIS